MAIIGALALMLFGPEQLPKVARKVGHVMRDIQNTSQAFIREMERAADEYEPEGAVPHYDPYLYEPLPERPPEPPAPADEARQTQPGTSPDGEAPRHARPSAQPEYRIE
jgi:Sec-independent protein translocase protein TatA